MLIAARYVVCLLMLFSAPCLSAAPKAGTAPIRPTNYTSGTVIHFPVPLIRGELADRAAREISVVNLSSKRKNRVAKGLARDGRFKVLCELVPGENRLVLKAGSAERRLTIIYRRNKNPYCVRMIYMTDKSGETKYQTPIQDDKQNYADKLDTAMKVLQTMTAERMHDLGYGRRTFNLELNAQGRVKVHTYRGKLSAAEYYAMNDRKWWGRIYQEMRDPYPTRTAKNIVVAAYTRFNPKTGKAQGHTALGGGGLALFGSGNLFTWPNAIGEVQAAFKNSKSIDRRNFMDDSAYRSCFWGAASTTMGATLHELGHTFGLPHSNHPHDIMTRGFDRLNRVFILLESPSRASRKPRTFREEETACFAPISAAQLITSPWFADKNSGDRGRNDLTIRYEAKTDAIVVTSPVGVRYVGASEGGNMKYFSAPKPSEPAPKSLTVHVKEIRRLVSGNGFRIKAINARGHVKNVEFTRLIAK